MRKVKRRALILMCCILGALILFPVEEKVRGILNLKSWEKEASARGIPVTARDLAPDKRPNPPRYYPSQEAIEAELAWTKAFKYPPNVMAPCGPGKALPAWKAPSWRNANMELHTWDTFTESVNACDDKAAQLRDDIATRRFLPVLDFIHKSDSRMPSMEIVEAMTAALSADCLVALRRGDLATARADLVAMAAVSAATGEERRIASLLVRLSIERLVRGTLWEAMQARGWTDTQLAALQAAFAQPQFVAQLADAVEAERVTALDRMRHSPPSMAELQETLGSAGIPGFDDQELDPGTASALRIGWAAFLRPISNSTRTCREGAFLVFWRVAWIEQDFLRGQWAAVDRAEALRAAGRGSNWIAKRSPPTMPGGSPNESTCDRMRFWFSRSSTEFRTDALDGMAAEADAFRRLAVTAIALERYRLRHGKQPATLTDLVPDFLPAPPIDFMDGKPLRYRPGTNGTFLLYSVGADGRDEGGDLGNGKGDLRSYAPEACRDMGWPMPATPEEYDAYETRRFGTR